MSVINLTAEVKDRFFDRQKVIESIGRANARRLSRIGAFVRRRAITDVLRRGPKRRKKNGRRPSAKAGQPPYVWSNDSFATLRNVLFGLSWDNNAVVIGPRLVPSLKGMVRGSSAKTLPELLTKGGTNRVQQWSNDGETWEMGKAPQAAFHRTVQARYHPHPFMGPALEREIAVGTIGDVWSAEVA